MAPETQLPRRTAYPPVEERERVHGWLEAERIEAYLPELHRQRRGVADHLEALDELIRDEESAVREIRATVA